MLGGGGGEGRVPPPKSTSSVHDLVYSVMSSDVLCAWSGWIMEIFLKKQENALVDCGDSLGRE